MTSESILIGLVAAVAATALVIAVVVLRRQRQLIRVAEDGVHLTTPTHDLVLEVQKRGDLVAFVANPTKPDVADLRDAVRAACTDRGLPEPLWFETTATDPGVGQTHEAVRRGANVVVALGGDGTVRAVAAALVGTGIPMGLVPMGTGNLLARNLDIPLSDPKAAIRIAVTGRDRTIDVGWLTLDGPDQPHATAHPEHIFLVIAGLGFDAAMVADTDAALKARVGWMAYFLSGVRHLHGTRSKVHIRIDDRPPVTTRLRSLLVGNCGRLPGGITLLPDALLDDGWLDIAAIDTRGGLVGWAQLFGEVVLQGYGVRTDLPAKIGRIDHARARAIRLLVPAGEHVQVDGEVLGRATEVNVRVDPGALVVRVLDDAPDDARS
ncbi:MAG TPA: diacylglycerol kinase family protein [Cellulomonadaceae bacterium]|nr:diacylglycerol kinase family protein [Cellulomonadaceae bacterium]